MLFEYLNIVLYDLLKITALLVPVLIAVAMIVWVDRRVWGAVQLRKGPNVVGPFGLLQTAADALKYIFKEVIIPIHANKVIFIIAPIVTMSLALIAWAVIPFSETLVLANINVGILYIFKPSRYRPCTEEYLVCHPIIPNVCYLFYLCTCRNQ